MRLAGAATPYLVVSLLAAVACGAGAWLTGHPAFKATFGIAVALVLSFAWFFRDPERAVPRDPAVLLSPADGVVWRVLDGKGTRTIEIFLRLWDVHVQRAPADGRVTARDFTRGTYLVASDPKAGTRNTRCRSRFRGSRGAFAVTQVAGLIARRVECWVAPGGRVRQGERIGIIHMGSQVRLEIPKSARILVKPGTKVFGGLTPVAAWGRRG